ncbi:AAA family ATPase [Acutalibacter caecimuris]|uniref:AAA family ATPase n=1 Tax=Acutalibacter caecimuris TaxID=3093657 RepID=UPI002AC9238B|nr:AAA family ATPase [Acutalibacter sp. M00118]
MTFDNFLSRLEGVHKSGGQATARCPAHEDKHQSLSVSLGSGGKILLNCHAGCRTEAIVRALGLSMRDLFTEDRPTQKRQLIATYSYPGGVQKLRYSDKSFSWRKPDGKGGWEYNRRGVPRSLYIRGGLSGIIFAVEGEKDADNLHRLGYTAVSGEDGAGPGKWKKEYTEQLRGQVVVILPDNDSVGRDYAREVAGALYGAAQSVRLCDLSTVWPEIPEHGDISDMIAALGRDETYKRLGKLIQQAKEWEPDLESPGSSSLLSLFKPLDSFPEEEAKWLVPGWIPEGQISVIAADGGIGKTTLWCHIIAALSSGRSCILDSPGHVREPMRITFFTTEDSVRKKLKKKLRLAGANMNNITTPDFVGDRDGLLHKLKFGSPEMEEALRALRPVLCVFDPVQGFTPPKVNMGSRNEMRDCLAPLVSIGEDINTTALIICHTNKRPKAYGRDRIADSADLWDIARSVMMAGFTDGQGVRYLSNEKNNYGALQETILFTIDNDGQIQKAGTSWKRDREYIQGAEHQKSAPMREDCKAFIMKTLTEAGGELPTVDLEAKATTAGYSFSAIKRAKSELKAEGKTRIFQTGSARKGNIIWYIQATSSAQDDFMELSEDTPTPFDEPKQVKLI